eukprot:jgi/Chlat1/8707/Chrsp88S08071
MFDNCITDTVGNTAVDKCPTADGFDLTPQQVADALMMRLRKLTSIEAGKVKAELKDLNSKSKQPQQPVVGRKATCWRSRSQTL